MEKTRKKRTPDARIRIERNMVHFWQISYSRSFSAGSQALFLKIMWHAHLNGWKDTEIIMNTRLVGTELGLGKAALNTCIEELVERGIVTYKPGIGRGNGSTFRLLASEPS